MGELCEVSPYLPAYDTVKEIPVAGCGTVWMSLDTRHEYLKNGDQFLFFGMMLSELLLNPNQFRAYSIEVNDNPSDISQELGMDCGEVFLCFDTTGTIVHLESQAPTGWEIKHLPHIYISSDQWTPSDDTMFPECKM